MRMLMKTNKSYKELRKLLSFEDRFDYLSLRGIPGESTFGFDRYINQQFYRSSEWKRIRDFVIERDNGCDLGIDGYEIHDRIIIHHMNPMSPEDIKDTNIDILSQNFLITTTHRTHNAIHYGDKSLLRKKIIPRSMGDTKLW